MRDIRGDLQDRAGFLEEQISAAQAQFEKRMELFTREHESKIADLQAELEAVSMLMEREYRRIMSAPDVADERRQPQQTPEQAPVASAPEVYEGSGYLEDEPEYDREDDRYREPAVAESAPARRAAPAEEARPARREPEPHYAPRPAARAEDDHRPMSAERQDVERRPAEAAPYRPAARAPEPRPEAPRQEPQRHEAPRHEAPREESPRHEAPRQEQPRREEPPRRYEPVQRDRGPVQTQRQPLADFLIRKLGEVGNMSLDDLCSVAIQEGYFAEGDNPDRTVHMTLMNVVKAGFIRQMPNGTFAPASVMDTIRLRRAI
jgi:hypothetical protein